MTYLKYLNRKGWRNVTVQSNISLLWRLTTAISPAPLNSDCHKMHKLDKAAESLNARRNVQYDHKTTTCPEKKWLLKRDVDTNLIFYLEMAVNYYPHD